jgi:hypothetical protein
VHPRLGLEVERFLHLLERRRDAALAEPAVDEHQQFVLLARQHGLFRPGERMQNN